MGTDCCFYRYCCSDINLGERYSYTVSNQKQYQKQFQIEYMAFLLAE